MFRRVVEIDDFLFPIAFEKISNIVYSSEFMLRKRSLESLGIA